MTVGVSCIGWRGMYKESHDGAEELLKAPTTGKNLRLTEQFF